MEMGGREVIGLGDRQFWSIRGRRIKGMGGRRMKGRWTIRDMDTTDSRTMGAWTVCIAVMKAWQTDAIVQPHKFITTLLYYKE